MVSFNPFKKKQASAAGFAKAAGLAGKAFGPLGGLVGNKVGGMIGSKVSKDADKIIDSIKPKSHDEMGPPKPGLFGKLKNKTLVAKDAAVSKAKGEGLSGPVKGQNGTNFCPKCEAPISGVPGNYVCNKCGWHSINAFTNTGAFMNQGAAMLKKGFAKVLGVVLAALAFIGFPIFAIAKGWIGFWPAAFTILFIILFGVFVWKHKPGLSFVFFILAIGTVASSTDIFTIGVLAQSTDGVKAFFGAEDAKLEDLGDLFSLSAKAVGCRYSEFVDPENPKPKCQQNLTNSNTNIQEADTDISIASFTAEPKNVVPGQSVIVGLTLTNDGSETRSVKIVIAPVPDSNGQYAATLRNPPAECINTNDVICTFEDIEIAGSSEKTVNVVYKLAGADEFAQRGSLNFYANATYDFSVISTLLLETTDDIQAKRSRVQSRASAGSGNLIIFAQNQPLYVGDTFQFGFTIDNNQDGILKDVLGYLLIPADIVEKPEEDSCINAKEIPLGIITPSEEEDATEEQRDCAQKIGDKGNYYCMTFDHNADVNGEESPLKKIEEEEKFFCTLTVKDENSITNELSKSVYGELLYNYERSQKVGIVVQ